MYYDFIADDTLSSDIPSLSSDVGMENVNKGTTVPTLSSDVAMVSSDANKISSGISVETTDMVTTETVTTKTTSSGDVPNLIPLVTITEATDSVVTKEPSGNKLKLQRQYAVTKDDELHEPVEQIDDVTASLTELSIGNLLCMCVLCYSNSSVCVCVCSDFLM